MPSANSDPATRAVHLVGTIPVASAQEAFGFAADTLGDAVPAWLPDGETGNRQDWINRVVESLRSHPDLELDKDGAWTGYKDTPAFKVRRGRQFASVDLDYLDAFEASWPAFEEFRAGHTEDLLLQIGIPGHLDLALVAFGFKLRRGLRNLGPFRDATVRAITEIHEAAGSDVVFQLEVPIELIMLTKLPKPLRRFMSDRLAREALRVVADAPEGTRFGIHLCYGDMNNESLGDPKDSGVLVLFANSLLRQWPGGRELLFLHAPFALGKEPPPLERSFYEPLAALQLPDRVRFAGGFVHEGRSEEQLVGIRDDVEALLGRRIDVAASCGLGRRDLAHARRNTELARAVAAAD